MSLSNSGKNKLRVCMIAIISLIADVWSYCYLFGDAEQKSKKSKHWLSNISLTQLES